jgi:hypothetical protein
VSRGRLSLLSRTTTNLYITGGDVNITDEDGDTPLYTVEKIETARLLIEHGARYDHVNAEGLTVRLDLILHPFGPLILWFYSRPNTWKKNTLTSHLTLPPSTPRPLPP